MSILIFPKLPTRFLSLEEKEKFWSLSFWQTDDSIVKHSYEKIEVWPIDTMQFTWRYIK